MKTHTNTEAVIESVGVLLLILFLHTYIDTSERLFLLQLEKERISYSNHFRILSVESQNLDPCPFRRNVFQVIIRTILELLVHPLRLRPNWVV